MAERESQIVDLCAVFLAIHVDEIGKTISRISLFAIWDSIDLVRNENVQKKRREIKKEKERNQFYAIESQKISGSSHRPNRSFAAAHRLTNLYYWWGRDEMRLYRFFDTMKEMLSRPNTSHVELFFWSILGTNQSAVWHGNHRGFHSEEVFSESKKFVRFNGKRMERTTSARQQRIPDITSLFSFSTPVLGAWTLRPNSPQSQQPLYLAAMEFVCSYTNWVFLFFVSLAPSRKKQQPQPVADDWSSTVHTYLRDYATNESELMSSGARTKHTKFHRATPLDDMVC